MFKKYDWLFFAATLISFLLANYLLIMSVGATSEEEKKSLLDSAFFVSLWVPTNLILGIYFRNIATTAPTQSMKYHGD
jgi:hypothetical protein